MQYFNPRSRSLLSRAIITVLSFSFVSGNGIAQVPDPEPTTYTDVPVPQLTGWNDSNILTTIDGVTSATDKSWIYESVAAKEVAEIEGNDRTEGSVAAVFWELDNGSGRAPGIQVVTDNFDFPTNNCIMASGEIESTDFPGTIVAKTCSDDEGSSKRYFLELTESDAPVDLAFDLGVKDIRYKGVKDPETDGGEALAEFRATYGIGRIYRVIQKVINNTDKRIASYKFELGTGVGDAFQPLTFEEHTVAFEMRPLVPREFFEGETGAPDISVWNPQRFATISPKMFDDGSRPRFDPGFLDHAAAGFLPPQLPPEGVGVEKSQFIDSGTSIVDGIIGSMTPNYFNVADTQGVVIPGNMLGYQLPDLLIPTVIGEYNSNEVGGESDAIVAIWDGVDWRSGRAGLDGDPLTPLDNYAVIPLAQLQQWAAKPLGLNIPGEAEDDIVRYEGILSDDLSGLNTDIFIYIGDKLLDESGALILDSITLRVTANSVEAVIGDVAGTEDPLWLANQAPTLASYMPATGTPIAINDIATTVETDPVTIDIVDNDLLDGLPLVLADGSVSITTQPADGNVVINADNSITYTADAGFTGTDWISYTVTQTLAGPVSNIATIKVVVDAAPIPDSPTAIDDSAVMFQGTSLALDVLANDELNKESPSSVVVSINNNALNGVASVAADNGIAYTPATGFIGFERFTYIVTVDGIDSNSALVTIRVDDPDEVTGGAPVANDDSAAVFSGGEVIIDVLANDELNNSDPGSVVVSIDNDALNGAASVADDNSIVYASVKGFTGVEQFSYIVTVDGVVSNSALVTVSVDKKKSSNNNGFCSAGGPGGPFDPLLPGMVLLALAGLWIRRTKNSF